MAPAFELYVVVNRNLLFVFIFKLPIDLPQLLRAIAAYHARVWFTVPQRTRKGQVYTYLELSTIPVGFFTID